MAPRQSKTRIFPGSSATGVWCEARRVQEIVEQLSASNLLSIYSSYEQMVGSDSDMSIVGDDVLVPKLIPRRRIKAKTTDVAISAPVGIQYEPVLDQNDRCHLCNGREPLLHELCGCRFGQACYAVVIAHDRCLKNYRIQKPCNVAVR